jgi:hypothetical protein
MEEPAARSGPRAAFGTVRAHTTPPVDAAGASPRYHVRATRGMHGHERFTARGLSPEMKAPR